MASVTVIPNVGATSTTRYSGDSVVTGNAWVNPGNITAEDGVNATNSGGSGQGTYLIGSDFRSGGIPLSSIIGALDTIVSITGRYKRFKTSSSPTESGCVLRTSSRLVSAEMNNSSAYPASLTDRTFTATFTGTTADVRDSTFGLSVRNSGFGNVRVDVMELTITYTPAATSVSAHPRSRPLLRQRIPRRRV